MINSEKFIIRLKKIIDYYSESASSFSEKIGVQRSSTSHILSGRNKPSLDFVTKVLNAYPDVDLYWLLNGKGSFPKKPTPIENVSATITQPQIATPPPIPKKEDSSNKTIERIVIFYSDGSFKSFTE